MEGCIFKSKTDTKYQNLKNALGSEELANEIIFNNNNHYLEYTSEGIDSILYNDLLNLFQNKHLALTIKAKWLSDSFREKHKDFIASLQKEDYDKNGEIKSEKLYQYLYKVDNKTIKKSLNVVQDFISDKLLGMIEVDIKQFKSEMHSTTDPGKFLKYLESKLSVLKMYKSDDNGNLSKLTEIIGQLEQRIELINRDILERKQKFSHRIYVDSLFKASKIIIENTNAFIELVNDNEYNPKDKKEFLQTYLSLNKDYEFLRNLLENLTINDEYEALIIHQKKLLDQISEIASKFNSNINGKISIKDRVLKFTVEEIREDLNIDQSFITDLFYDSNGNIKPFKRDDDFTTNAKRWLETNFLDLTKQNNPLMQALGYYVDSRTRYHNVSLKYISDNINSLFEKIKSNFNPLIFFQTDPESGEKIRRLVQKHKYNFADYRDFKGGKKDPDSVFGSMSKENASSIFNSLKSIFSYWDDNFIIDSISKDHKKYLKWKVEFNRLLEQLDSVESKKGKTIAKTSLKHHLVTNPLILNELYQLHKKNELKLDSKINLKELLAQHDILSDNALDLEIDFNDIIETDFLSYRSIFLDGNTRNVMFDQYMDFSNFTDKHITEDWKVFEQNYYSKNQDVKQFYDYLLETSQQNNSIMPSKNGFDKYDLFNADLTLEEEMIKNDSKLKGLLNGVLDNAAKFLYVNSQIKDSFKDSITTNISKRGRKYYNYVTDQYEYYIAKPSSVVKTVDEGSLDLANIFIQQTAAAHLYSVKKEIEPFAKFTLSYLQNQKIEENGVVRNAYSKEEVEMLDSVMKQLLYGVTDDANEKATRVYLDEKEHKKWIELKEEERILHEELKLKQKLTEEDVYKLNTLSQEIKQIESQAVHYSFLKTVNSVNNFAKVSTLGFKASAAVADGVIGLFSNIAEASTNVNFSINDFFYGLYEVMKSFLPGQNDKIDKLMKLNNVDTKLTDLTTVVGGNKGSHSFSNVAYMYFRVSQKLNVVPVMIAMLKNKKINIAGKEYNIWECYDNNGKFLHDPIYDPYINDEGKLKQSGNNVAMEINDVIHSTHGNPGEAKPSKMNNAWYGKLILTFKKWLANIADNLFADEKTDFSKRGRKSGEVIATKNLFLNNTFQDFIPLAMQFFIQPYKNMATGSKSNFKSLNDLDSAQVTKFSTRIQLFIIANLLLYFLTKWEDEKDEVYYEYDETTKKMIKKRGKQKEYASLLESPAKATENFFFNSLVRLSNESNPLSPILSLTQGSSSSAFPIINYLHNVYDVMHKSSDYFDYASEVHFDDKVNSGAWKDYNKTLLGLWRISRLGGFYKDLTYTSDREYVQNFNK